MRYSKDDIDYFAQVAAINFKDDPRKVREIIEKDIKKTGRLPEALQDYVPTTKK